jgi:hypothetical protein
MMKSLSAKERALLEALNAEGCLKLGGLCLIGKNYFSNRAMK